MAHEDDFVTPEGLLPEHLDYLDALRDSGEINMFGSRPYIQKEFNLERRQAAQIVTYWMATYPRSVVSQENC